MKKPVPVESASAFIDEKIKQLAERRGKTLAKVPLPPDLSDKTPDATPPLSKVTPSWLPTDSRWMRIGSNPPSRLRGS
jgi:hypothetical protein